MLTARSYWCVGRVVRSLYEELARSYALCFRELGMAENHAPTLRHYLLQDFAYSYRVWITLSKLLSASVWSPRIHPDIHQGERLYGSLLPSVPLVSEKNSSGKFAEQTCRQHSPRYLQVRGCMQLASSLLYLPSWSLVFMPYTPLSPSPLELLQVPALAAGGFLSYQFLTLTR